jgi:hypothetical protein
MSEYENKPKQPTSVDVLSLAGPRRILPRFRAIPLRVAGGNRRHDRYAIDSKKRSQSL